VNECEKKDLAKGKEKGPKGRKHHNLKHLRPGTRKLNAKLVRNSRYSVSIMPASI
jgi:hypothetical protein